MASKSISVAVSGDLDLEQCKAVLTAVFQKTGHPLCTSGYKVALETAVTRMTVDSDTLEVSEA